jgi:hypothetical protein
MIKLQHRVRRDGVVVVGGVVYSLDEDGCVEVTDEHAGWMREGSQWGVVGTWPVLDKVSKIEPAVGVGRAPRSKDEIREVLIEEGWASGEEESETKEEELELKEGEPKVEEITISPQTSRMELIRIARRLKIRTKSSMTQLELFELLKARGQKV